MQPSFICQMGDAPPSRRDKLERLPFEYFHDYELEPTNHSRHRSTDRFGTESRTLEFFLDGINH